MSLLRFDLQGVIGDAADFLMLDMVLNHKAPPTYDVDGYLTDGSAPHNVRGFEDKYSDLDRAAGIPSTYRKFIILGKGMTITPAIGDTVDFEGSTYTVRSVAPDPAKATYTLDCE